VTSISSYDFLFEISDGAIGGTYLTIDEVNEFSVDYSANNEEVDATTFADDGTYAGRMIQRGASLTLTGFYSLSSGSRSASQARIQTLGVGVGANSLGYIRWRHATETNWRVWNAYVTLGEVGGGNTDLASWEATFTKSGAETTASVA
jgi:hypothetical protein